MTKNVHTPFFVDWAVTGKCNLKCLHCRGATQSELPTARVLELAREIVEMEPAWVLVEGGEPLLREDIFRVLTELRAGGLEVQLITNGTIVSADTVARLADLSVNVMVSMDGADAATFEHIRRGASFDRVVEAASLCAERGLLEAINVTLSRLNLTQIPDMLDMAEQLGARQIIFIGIKPCQGYAGQLLSARDYEAAVSLLAGSIPNHKLDFFFDEPFFWPLVRERGLPLPQPAGESRILDSRSPGCIVGLYAFIEPNGDVRPCSFSPYVMGNASSLPLARIWTDFRRSKFWTDLRDPGTRKGNCAACKYLSECMGCRARSLALTGDWFASDPCCPLSNPSEVRDPVSATEHASDPVERLPTESPADPSVRRRQT